jgi:hypothetical protein
VTSGLRRILKELLPAAGGRISLGTPEQNNDIRGELETPSFPVFVWFAMPGSQMAQGLGKQQARWYFPLAGDRIEYCDPGLSGGKGVVGVDRVS